MLKILLVATAIAGFVCLAVADDNKVDEKKAVTRKERLIQLLNDDNKKRQVLADTMNGMKPGQERDKLNQQIKDTSLQTAQKLLDLAQEDVKDEIAFIAAFMAFRNGGGNKTSTDAADFIVNSLADDKRVVPSIPQMAHTEGGLPLLSRLAEKTTSKEIRGAARFAILDAEVDSIDYPPSGIPVPAAEAAARFAVATEKLSKLAIEFADVKVSTRMGNSVADAAKKKIYFIDNMTVGKKAPDFECALLDGKPAKLSDYRGNVVVLDVWATWCVPCKAMIPHERELVEKLKDKPFRLISLSVDDKKEILTRFLEKEKMPWTHMWNGPEGGFVDQYQIQSYPTIYVIDANGIIRFKHVRDEKMERAIETLLKEMSGVK